MKGTEEQRKQTLRQDSRELHEEAVINENTAESAVRCSPNPVNASNNIHECTPRELHEEAVINENTAESAVRCSPNPVNASNNIHECTPRELHEEAVINENTAGSVVRCSPNPVNASNNIHESTPSKQLQCNENDGDARTTSAHGAAPLTNPTPAQLRLAIEALRSRGLVVNTTAGPSSVIEANPNLFIATAATQGPDDSTPESIPSEGEEELLQDEEITDGPYEYATRYGYLEQDSQENLDQPDVKKPRTDH